MDKRIQLILFSLLIMTTGLFLGCGEEIDEEPLLQWKAKSVVPMSQQHEAIVEAAVDKQDLDTLMEVAGRFYDSGDYRRAADTYLEAQSLYPHDHQVTLMVVDALYNGDRHMECLRVAEQALEGETDFRGRLLWYAGLCQLELLQLDQASATLEEAIGLEEDKANVMADRAELAFLQGDIALAKDYIERVLDLEPDNFRVGGMQAELALMESKPDQLVQALMTDDYLYDLPTDIEERIASSMDQSAQEVANIHRALETVKSPEDPFTYVYQGEEYDLFHEPFTDPLQFQRVGADQLRVKWNAFLPTSDEEFVDYLDQVENRDQLNLILDLRGNGGGVTDSAANMLDALLPEGVTVELEFKVGENYQYYSDNSALTFKKILVLVDGDTASAGEMLALGLQRFHANALIVGQPTFGKGVGQRVFENPMKKFGIAVVNHYWSVDGVRVHETGVQPDILVETHSYEDMLKAAGL